MEPKAVRLGSSLIVPSMQELVKQPIVTVPPRYVRSDLDPPILPDAYQVPVINMNALLSQNSELGSLHSACKDWGFFQLVNHGVEVSLLEKLKKEIQDFFNLPMEEKKKFWQFPGEVEGFGQTFVVSEEQKLDWSDIFFMVTRPIHLRKPHLFPNLPLPLRDTFEMYSSEMRNLYVTILAQMAKALDIKAEDMKDLFEDGRQAMRINYYPPCPQTEQVFGLTPHSDASVLTILLQVNDMEGLQIKKDGKWVPVKPLPNAFIVNIGDMLEMITNGVYRSIEHRAIVNADNERLSIATFCSARYEALIGPAASLTDEQRPALYRTVTVEDYLKGLFARKLDGKSCLDTVRLPN